MTFVYIYIYDIYIYIYVCVCLLLSTTNPTSLSSWDLVTTTLKYYHVNDTFGHITKKFFNLYLNDLPGS